MNFIRLAETAESVSTEHYIVAAVLLLAGILCVGAAFDGGGNLLNTVFALGAFVMSGVFFFSTSPVEGDAEKKLSERNSQVQEQIEDYYGIELTEGEVKELKYPAAEPEDDFKVYGTAERNLRTEGTSFERQEVSLIWNGKDFELARSSDGEAFTSLEPLPVKEPAKPVEKPVEVSDKPFYAPKLEEGPQLQLGGRSPAPTVAPEAE